METVIDKQVLILEGHRFDKKRILETHPESMGDKNFIALFYFMHEWFNDSPTLNVHTSGSTGDPKEITVEKERMINSAIATCSFLKLKPGDTALLCMSLDFIGGKMMVVRALVAGLSLIVTEPCGHPLKDIYFPCTFAAMVPLQVYNTLQNPGERWLLGQIKHTLIGGGTIDTKIVNSLQDLHCQFWSTYGMTETLSHIALRALNGKDASPYYKPFADVKLSLSEEETLIIDAPKICSEPIHTNDIAELNDSGFFKIIGRKDNIINSGGIKIQIEEVENKIRSVMRQPYAITSIPDTKFGEIIVLLLQNRDNVPTEIEIKTTLKKVVPSYWQPKRIIYVPEIPKTDNGKINRAEAKILAMERS